MPESKKKENAFYLSLALSLSLHLLHTHRWDMANDMQANLEKLLLIKARTMETKYIVMQYREKKNTHKSILLLISE